MNVIAIIPAQGRSVAVPLKNIVPLHGKPLLCWTIEAALASKRLSRIVVSTEHGEISNVAMRYELVVDIIGQPVFPSTLDMLQWAVRYVEDSQVFRRWSPADAVMCLQPTCPLRRASDIDGAIDLMERTGCDSVVSYVNVGANHPARMARITDDHRVLPIDTGETFTRRQDLPPYYIRSGDIYLTRRDVLLGGSLVGKDQRAWIIPPERACNIDEKVDVPLAAARMEWLEYQTT